MLDLGTPDDFRGQPYAWLTNQMAHLLVGLARRVAADDASARPAGARSLPRR